MDPESGVGDDPGKAQHAEDLESVVDRADLQPVPVRNLPHAKRHRAVSTRVRPDADLHLDLPGLRPRHGVRVPGDAALAKR